MKLPPANNYSVLSLKGTQKSKIEESWKLILGTAYLFSKEVLIYFPLPDDLIKSVDRILDEIVDRLGTNYFGLRYLRDLDDKRLLELLRCAKYFITDHEETLQRGIRWKKPCIYFDEETKHYLFISKTDKSYQIFEQTVKSTCLNLRCYDSDVFSERHPSMITT